MQWTPFILGHGLAGRAIGESLAVVAGMEPAWQMAPPQYVERGAALGPLAAQAVNPILAIANPHGLHAAALQEASAAGFKAILCEKPSCTQLDEVAGLRRITTPVAVAHVYRQTWGVQQLKTMLDGGELGDIICIEGRYWQSSSAARAIAQDKPPERAPWKTDPTLTGPYDTLLDLGTHWMDAVCFLVGEAPKSVQGWLSYRNAPSPGRDTHVQLTLDFANGTRALASISKTMHGAANDFEIVIMGTRGSAVWQFLRPDEIRVGEGNNYHVRTRASQTFGARHPAHHSLGWLEGYVDIWHALLGTVGGSAPRAYPDLQTNLTMLEALLRGRFTVSPAS